MLIYMGFLVEVLFIIVKNQTSLERLSIELNKVQQSFVYNICMGAGLLLQSCLTLCDPIDCNPPGSSIHGILQARILECVAMPSSRGSSQPRDQTCVSHVSCVGRRFFTTSTICTSNDFGLDILIWEDSHAILLREREKRIVAIPFSRGSSQSRD